MVEFLIAAAVLGGIVFLALSRDRHRERMIRIWIEHHPGATLHWPFDPGKHPEFPVAALLEKSLGRPPVGFASAVELRQVGGGRWWVEFRITPPGRKTTFWFTLSAHQAGAEWVCASSPGTITVKALDAFAASSGSDGTASSR